jgi:hypothetical protein
MAAASREEPEQAHRLEGGPVELEPVGIGVDLASPDAEDLDAFGEGVRRVDLDLHGADRQGAKLRDLRRASETPTSV